MQRILHVNITSTTVSEWRVCKTEDWRMENILCNRHVFTKFQRNIWGRSEASASTTWVCVGDGGSSSGLDVCYKLSWNQRERNPLCNPSPLRVICCVVHARCAPRWDKMTAHKRRNGPNQHMTHRFVHWEKNTHTHTHIDVAQRRWTWPAVASA